MLSPGLMKLILAIRKAGGTPLIVGGFVRDHIMWRTSKDVDIEVYGLHPDVLTKVCIDTVGEYAVNAVGKSFGVLKVAVDHSTVVDISTPRTENKVGRGHRGFMVTPSPNMSPRDAAGRRDFTMNSLAMDPITKEVLDFYGGKDDLQMGILRATTPAYMEDPLRVLRGMQFAARFNLVADPRTAAMSHAMIEEYSSLPVERIWAEWYKWSLARNPQAGLQWLVDTAWYTLYSPFYRMMHTVQDKEWHPEGTVWQHTGYTVNAAAQIAVRDSLKDEDRSVLVFAALCHDMGKVDTTVIDNLTDRVTSPGHAEVGVILAGKFLQRIGAPEWLQKRVLSLVGDHMWSAGGNISDRSIRRLTHRLGAQGNTILDLGRLVEADCSGRPPLEPFCPRSMRDAVRRAEEMKIDHSGPTPIMLGRHLIELGMEPGPLFKTVLNWCFEQQLEGKLTSVEIGKEMILDQKNWR